MIRILFTCTCIVVIGACSGSDFRGTDSSNNHSGKQLNQGNATTNNTNTQTATYTGTGGILETASCSSKDVQDESATFQFGSNEEIRSFVNTFCKANVPVAWKNQGALRNDEETKKILCQLKGFKQATGVVQFSWSSPGDNHIAWWQASSKSFFVKYDATDHNNMIKHLTCQGKLYAQCVPQQSAISCTQ